MSEIRKRIYEQLIVPRVTVKYDVERSEHFGQIRSHLVAEMALEHPAREHEINLAFDEEEGICDEMREVFDYFEDVEMKVFDDKGYGLFLRPHILRFVYDGKKLLIYFLWVEVE